MQGGAAKGRNYGLSKLHSAKVTKNGRVFCVYFSLGLKEKNKNVQNLEKTAGYNKYEQRSYDNLNNLYANVKKKQEA